MINKRLAISGQIIDLLDWTIYLQGDEVLRPHVAQFQLKEPIEKGVHEVRFFATTDDSSAIQNFVGFAKTQEQKDDRWILTCHSLASLAVQRVPVPEGTNIKREASRIEQALDTIDYRKPAGISIKDAFSQYSEHSHMNFVLPTSDDPKHYVNIKRSNVVMDPKTGFAIGKQYEMRQPFWVELPTGEIYFSDWPDGIHKDTEAIKMDRIGTFNEKRNEITSQWINGIWPGAMIHNRKDSEGRPSVYYAKIIKITSDEKMKIFLKEVKL